MFINKFQKLPSLADDYGIIGTIWDMLLFKTNQLWGGKCNYT